MNCISKYIVTNKEERRVLGLARTFKNSRFYIWSKEESQLFIDRYEPTRTVYHREIAKAPLSCTGFEWREDWDKAFRESSRLCVKEAQEIKRREIDSKNLTYNCLVFMLQGLVGGIINVVGGMGGGIHYIPDEEAYRLNYKTK